MKFEENEDQKVLLEWIVAGLKIAKDEGNFRGDAGYLLNNMIAKYTLFASEYRISIKAEEYMREEHQFDPENFYKRRAFYGKSKGVIYEHPIPATVVRKKLFDLKKPTEASVREILQKSGKVTVLLREGEDDDLRAAGLSSQMPLGWEWDTDSKDARYKEIGIDISTAVLKVDGAVCR
jgi:hypothetical protein